MSELTAFPPTACKLIGRLITFSRYDSRDGICELLNLLFLVLKIGSFDECGFIRESTILLFA